MNAASERRSDTTDQLDLKIAHCLQVAPRAPFAAVAAVLGVSEQTVARRYRRLRSSGVARVVGLIDPEVFGQQNWSLWLRCRPDSAEQIARALARRDDVHWVALLSGGTEVCCVLRARSDHDRDHLLLRQLPRTAEIDSIEAYGVLHVFRGASTADWRVGGADLLQPEQYERLSEHAIATDGRHVTFEAADDVLVRELMRDGRATYASLAAAAGDGRTDAQVRRRVEELCAARVLYFDVDVRSEAFGGTVNAFLVLVVSPAQLHAVGEALARHDSVLFAAATTGSASIMATVSFATMAQLYAFIADEVGQFDGVGQVRVLPVSKAIKQAGSVIG